MTTTLWDDARHEVLNETNRDEVTQEIVDWLDAHLPEAGRVWSGAARRTTKRRAGMV